MREGNQERCLVLAQSAAAAACAGSARAFDTAVAAAASGRSAYVIVTYGGDGTGFICDKDPGPNHAHPAGILDHTGFCGGELNQVVPFFEHHIQPQLGTEDPVVAAVETALGDIEYPANRGTCLYQNGGVAACGQLAVDHLHTVAVYGSHSAVCIHGAIGIQCGRRGLAAVAVVVIAIAAVAVSVLLLYKRLMPPQQPERVVPVYTLL